MSGILYKLKGGDLRSIGKSEEVVQDISKNPELFSEVFDGLFNNDPRIRMRCADVLEKVSSKHPEYLQPYKKRLLNDVSTIEQQEVRWHVAQMFSYLDVNKREKAKIIRILLSYLDTDKSKIVKVFSMQTLADLADNDDDIKPVILKKIKEVMKEDSPAIVSRAKKIINKLEK